MKDIFDLNPPDVCWRRTSDVGQRTAWLLAPFSWLYRLAVGIRLFLYRSGVFQQKRLMAKVISVGNITVGGTGKTPLVIYLAERLKENGKNVAILTRGYKRKKKEMVDLLLRAQERINWEDVGDEPYLMMQNLSDVPIIVSKHRVISGLHAIEKYGAEILILDDGFQHLKLHRDIDIVVIDSTNPFGKGKLLPAGRLREPLSSLKRAALFVLTKTDQASDLDELIRTLQKYNPQAPLVESIYRIRSIDQLSDGASVNLKEVEHKKALAFSGIGNPSSFENSLNQLKIQILKHHRFSDHFAYHQRDILSLIEEAKSLKADFIITTEKDSVRIPLINQSAIQPQAGFEIPFYVLKIDLKITKGEKILLRKIEL
jgi:3-deoxy-D-manno-octulosonic-acid transferase